MLFDGRRFITPGGGCWPSFCGFSPGSPPPAVMLVDLMRKPSDADAGAALIDGGEPQHDQSLPARAEPRRGSRRRGGASRRGPLGLPTPPKGWPVGSYPTYAEAQRAVDYLSDNQFPVQQVTIVGVDLMQVERVTGRLTWGKVLGGGVLSGAWLGVFIGLVLGLFSNNPWASRCRSASSPVWSSG